MVNSFENYEYYYVCRADTAPVAGTLSRNSIERLPRSGLFVRRVPMSDFQTSP
jgi:hypothetical protein